MSVRTRRNLVAGLVFVSGLVLIVGGIMAPIGIRLQVVSVILGILLYQTALLRMYDRFLPNERRFLALRAETDRLLNLVRDLNQAASAAQAMGTDSGPYVQPILEQMHEAVDRLPAVAADVGPARQTLVH
ncbi:MAG TPA: hypothetical protein VJ957_01045 [Longimicrobiales bacterium]|nr:hypothetical protein [Longimicrobiales bacterium]